MPHKRNPISSENIAGCSRVLRGYMVASYENIPLWHERDISHSSAERIIIPDAIMLLDYMLNRYTRVLENVTVFEDRMMKNIYLTNGVIFSQRILSKLIEKGLSREKAYDTIQPLSMKSWEEGLMFKDLLLESKYINEYLTKEEIEKSFDIAYFLKNVDEIFRRVGII